jgi:uncharacterized membrane protein
VAGTPTPRSALPDIERALARLLTVGTWVAVALLAVGSIVLLAAGRSPLDAGDVPALDPSGIPGDLLAIRPEAFLWLGLVAVIATPAARVVASLVGYVRTGERPMALVSLAILGVIAVSIVLGFGTEG